MLPEFAYAQARVQARHGDMARSADWQSIEASRSGAQFLAAVRATALAAWVDGLDDSSDTGRIERVLRARWVAYVAHVARWLPERWRAVTTWFGVVPDLALIEARRTPAAQRALLEAGEPAQPGNLHAVFTAPDARSTLAAWREEFDRRVPTPAPAAADLLRPAQLLLPALGGDPAGRAFSAGAARFALIRLLRRYAATPVAVFAHLALVALDVERLRGGLLARHLFART